VTVKRNQKNACRCPDEIREKVSVNDLDLLCWYPSLRPNDEKKIHRDLAEYKICGEWFSIKALDKIYEIIKEENKANECSKEDAIKTNRRL
jgi:hypothetical protein